MPEEKLAAAGGKGAVLCSLSLRGYPIPPGFVILPEAFVGDHISDSAWDQVQNRIEEYAKPDGELLLAVRSSATGEDSRQASFAGEFETVLNVKSLDELRRAIWQVRASRTNERVTAYRHAKDILAADEMAVVVQQQIEAEISGVLFTADPVTGSRMHMPGNYSRGLGDALVSGAVSANTFTLAWPKGTYSGPPEFSPYAKSLYKYARRLQQHFAAPQDIEWALSAGNLYILQSRPVTNLQGFDPTTGEWNDSLTGDYLWTNTNLGEALVDVMTPLSWSWLRRAMQAWQMLPEYHPAGNIGGRAYFNVSAFAAMYRLLGMREDRLLENIAGTIQLSLPPGMEIPAIPVARKDKLSGLWNIIRFTFKQWWHLRNMEDYVSANQEFCRSSQDQIRALDDRHALLKFWESELLPRSREADLRLLLATDYSSTYTMALRKELLIQLDEAQVDVMLTNRSNGENSLECLAPLLGISQVASGQLSRTEYLARWGHRGPHEFELSLSYPAEDPNWLDNQIAHLRNSPIDVKNLRAVRIQEFEATWQEYKKHYPQQAGEMNKRLAEASRRAHLRESARSELTKIAMLMRTFALQAGQLTGVGEDVFFLTIEELSALLAGEQISAVNYLSRRRETYERYRALPPYPPIINGRFDPILWSADPDRRSEFYDAHRQIEPNASAHNERLIRGLPGSAGVVEGIVRCLGDPEEGNVLQPGEILVAQHTNVGWTPLFPLTAAIITDIGAPLSHAAIVARELGIPAVVGCGNATSRLADGDLVRVDGARGTVEIISEKQV
jgi:pyruvate,water dikinase